MYQQEASKTKKSKTVSKKVTVLYRFRLNHNNLDNKNLVKLNNIEIDLYFKRNLK
jgi:hypothetical protein